MPDAFVDADVIIRLLTGDDPEKQARATALFERVEKGELQLATPVTTIADVVYVLSSPKLYRVPRPEVAAMLIALLRLRNFRVPSRGTVIRALELYAATNLDFGDALMATLMLRAGISDLYSYDRHFDQLKGITRKEP